jgi:flagellar protein FlaG
MLSEVKQIDTLRASGIIASVDVHGSVPRDSHGKTEMEVDGSRRPNSESERVVEELNALMERLQTNLLFSIDDTTRRIVIKVIDANTQEVIRQIPPEETLRIASHISKLLGIFVNETA